MKALTGEIVIRGVWWELPEYYCSKEYFFNQFDMRTIDNLNLSITSFTNITRLITENIDQSFF